MTETTPLREYYVRFTVYSDGHIAHDAIPVRAANPADAERIARRQANYPPYFTVRLRKVEER